MIWDFLWCKAITFKEKTSILHQFKELKASGKYFIRDRISYGRLFIGSKLILVLHFAEKHLSEVGAPSPPCEILEPPLLQVR